MKNYLILTVILAAMLPSASAQDKPASAPTDKAAATEWTLPQDDEIYTLMPAGDTIYYVCADKVQDPQTPGGPPVRKRYSTIMAFDTKAGSVSNMLLTLPGQFNPDKLQVFAFRISPDGKYAAMDVHSSATTDSKIVGLYVVDLQTRKARKILPAADYQQLLWFGKELLVPTRAPAKAAAKAPVNNGPANGGPRQVTIQIPQHDLLQPMRYDTKGTRLGPVVVNGFPWAVSQNGDSYVMLANPNALNKPLASADVMTSGKLLVFNKAGKKTAEIPITPDRGYSVVYSPNLKFGATQACNITHAKKVPGMGMPLNAAVFSLDGKTTINLPEPSKPMGAVWVSDTGQLLSKDPISSELVFWDNKGQKTWSLPGVAVVTVYKDKVYYIEAASPKVIKTKLLEDNK
jgi:hypothetical protein